jgi:hypothetical protein
MRSKLKLNLDELMVDSFDTTKPAAKQGTVFGEQCTCYTNCTCPGCPTCDASCNGTCGATCDASCYGTCGDYTCAYTCGDSECGCDTYQPCTTAQYTNCGRYLCN